MALPAQLLRIAERQYSVFDLKQARETGMTQDMLDVRVRNGEIDSLHRGVYGIAGAPRSWERSLLAACLAGGRGAVVSHVAACQLWGLLDLVDPPVEISIPRARSPRFGRGSVVVRRPLHLPPAHTTIRHAIPVTNPLRTVVDVAGVVDAGVLQDVLDAGVSMKLFTIKAIDRMRARLAKPGRNGTGKLRQVLDQQVLTDVARTRLEARMGRLWRRFGLPAYTFQHVVRTPEGRFVARCDFAIVPHKVIVEVDGWESHGSPTAVDADNRREHRLLSQGWVVLRFSWWRIQHEPEAVAAEIRAVVSARAAVA